METLWCTTLSVQPVTIVDDFSVTTDGQEPCQLVRLVLTSRKMVLFIPRPWYRRCYPLTCLPCMITQDVSALPTFNPHGGAITHSSTGSKPCTPPVPKVVPRAWPRM